MEVNASNMAGDVVTAVELDDPGDNIQISCQFELKREATAAARRNQRRCSRSTPVHDRRLRLCRP